eukprot:TRINITY_DN3520_c0_g2_i1.p1 TRINITY_DN3520_c0_g2~~TRINITY_DN3520_c0_g2_i1.p1  ORF type:complete len:6558 (-),score=986.31 TRINITY_DN3520_c0_g2_i1:45-18044(-)
MTVNVAGGAGPYQYIYTPQILPLYGPNNTFAGLRARQYDVAAQDGAGCVESRAVVLTPRLVVSAFPAFACFQAATDVVLNIVGGQAPFTVTWLETGAVQTVESENVTFSGVRAGRWNFVVTDGAFYQQTASVSTTVPQNAQLLFQNVAVASSAIDSTSVGDGIVNATAAKVGSPGTPFSYRLVSTGETEPFDATQAGSGFFGNLPAGTYHLEASDSACKAAFDVTVSLRFFEVDSVTHLTCANDFSGSVTFYVSPYVVPYSISVVGFPQLTANNTNTVVGLPAGYLEFHLVDSSNPPEHKIVSAVLNQPEPLTARPSIHLGTGRGRFDGIAQVSSAGGTGTRRVFIQNGFSVLYNNLPMQVFDYVRVDANDVFWKVTDDSGCVVSGLVSTSIPFSLTLAPPPHVQAFNPSPACGSSPTGHVTLIAAGGTNVVYEVKNALNGTSYPVENYFPGVRAKDLPPGDYIAIATDTSPVGTVRRAQLSFSITSFKPQLRLLDVYNPPPEQPTLFTVAAYNTLTGVVAYAARHSSGTEYFRTANGPGQFSNVPLGSWSVIAIDTSPYIPECVSDPLAFSVVSQLTASVDLSRIVKPSCTDSSDGSLVIESNGGTLPHFYWVNGIRYTEQTITGLSAGAVEIVVKDSGNPQQSITIPSVFVFAPPALEIFAISRRQDPSISYNTANVYATGGTPPYRLQVNGSPLPAFGYISNLAEGPNVFEVEDSQGCRASATADVVQRFSIAALIESSQAPRCCSDTGSVKLASNPLWEYAMTGRDMVWQDSPVFTGLTHNVGYNFRVRDRRDPAIFQEVGIIFPYTPCVRVDFVVPDRSLGMVYIATSPSNLAISIDRGDLQQSGNVYLAPGHYSVQADRSGCRSDPLEFDLLAPIQVSAVPSFPQCSGEASGAISFTITGGLPPYKIRSASLTGGSWVANISFFRGLLPGFYDYEVTDSGSPEEMVRGSTYVQPTNRLYLDLDTVALASGPSVSDGSIALFPAYGGLAPYSYEIANSTGGNATVQLSTYFGGLRAGNYSVSVIDRIGCKQTKIVPVVTRVNGSAIATSVQCVSGDPTLLQYQVTVSGSQGSGSYEFAVHADAYGSSPTFTVSAFIDSAFVRDLYSGDVARIPIQNNPYVGWRPLRVSSSAVPTSTVAGNITLAAFDGKGPYSYRVDSTSQSSAVFVAQATGSHTWTVSDSISGCSLSGTVIVPHPADIQTFVQSVTKATCYGRADGSITISNPTGGVGGSYTFTLVGYGSDQPSNIFNGLAAGTYTVRVSDGNGSQLDLTDIIVGSPAPITIVARIASDASASATLTAPQVWASIQGGNTEQAYNLTADGNQLTLQPQSSNTHGYPLAGFTAFRNYTVIATDWKGCNASSIVSYFPKPVLSAALTPISCSGASNARIDLSVVSGGSGSFKYRLRAQDAFVDSASFIDLPQAEYSPEVWDTATNLFASTFVSVREPSPLQLLTAVYRGPSGSTNRGAFTASAIGGTRPYTFSLLQDSIVPMTATSEGSWANLPVEFYYEAHVTDSRGCQLIAAPLYLRAPIALNLAAGDAPCAGSTASILATASGGNGVYEYAIVRVSNTSSVSNTSLLSWTSSPAFSGLVPGGYRVFARDTAPPEMVVEKYISVGQPAPLVLVASSTGVTQTVLATVSLTATGGIAPYYIHFGDSVAGSTTPQSIDYPNVGSGLFSAQVVDANSCSLNITVNVSSKVEATSSATNVLCNGDNTGSISLSPAGGSGLYTIVRLDAPNLSSNTSYTRLPAAVYRFHVFDSVNPANDAIVSQVVTQPSSRPRAVVTASARATIDGAGGNLTVVGFGGVGPYSYQLDRNGTVSPRDFVNLTAGVYTLTITDSNGCSESTFTTVLSTLDLIVTSATAESCAGVGDGSLTLQARGGQPPYRFQLLPNGPIQLEPTFRNLIPGSYSIKVWDSRDDVAAGSFVLSGAVVPVANPLVSQVSTIVPGESVKIKISGAAGAPWQWQNGRDGSNYANSAEQLGSIRVFDSCSGTAIVLDRFSCRHQIAFECVSRLSVVPELVSTTCNASSNLAVVTIRVRALGGQGPYTHQMGYTTVQDNVEVAVDNFYLGYELSFVSTDSWTPPYDFYSTPKQTYFSRVRLPRWTGAFVLDTPFSRPASAFDRADGSVVIKSLFGHPFSGVLSYANDTQNALQTLSSQSDSFFLNQLLPGNYTFTATSWAGCMASQTFIVGQPPAPTVSNFNCRLALERQMISCSWSLSFTDRYRVSVASSTLANDTRVYRPLLDSYQAYLPTGPEQLAIPYELNLVYFVKLAVSNSGGTTESELVILANQVRPTAPSQARLETHPSGIFFTWSASTYPYGDFFVYTVSIVFGSTEFVAARDVEGSSYLWPTRETGGYVGSSFYIRVLARSITNQALSAVPAVPQSEQYIWSGAPELPYVSWYISDCSRERCIQLQVITSSAFGILSSLRVEYSLSANRANITEEDDEPPSWTLLQDVSRVFHPQNLLITMPPLPFGSTVTARATFTNLAGSSVALRDLFVSEVPGVPNLQTSVVGSTVDIDVYYARLSCTDPYLAAAVQPSQFVYEWTEVTTQPSQGDWVNSTKSLPLAGAISVPMNASGATLLTRCVAVNPAGATASAASLVSPPLKASAPLLTSEDKVASSGKVQIQVVLEAMILPAGTVIVGVEFRAWGLDCRDEYVSSIEPTDGSTFFRHRQPFGCNILLSGRFLTNRGAPTAWSAERLVISYIEAPVEVLQPLSVALVNPAWYGINQDPFWASLPPPNALYGDTVTFIAEVILSGYAADYGVTYLLLEAADNGTARQNTSTITQITAPDGTRIVVNSTTEFAPVKIVPLAFGRSLITFDMPLEAQPLEYRFRLRPFNSQPCRERNIATISVIGQPSPPSLVGSYNFDPVNGTVYFKWSRDRLPNVTFDVDLHVSFLNGSSYGQNFPANDSVFSMNVVPAGTTVALTVTPRTYWRVGQSSSAAVTSRSGDYWASNTTTLAPVLVSQEGLTVTMQFVADRSSNGFARQNYVISYALDSITAPRFEYTRMFAPEPAGDGTITFRFRSYGSHEVFFFVTPFNDLGTGPTSLPSAAIPVFDRPTNLNIIAIENSVPLVADKATLKIMWYPQRFVSTYSWSLKSSSGGEVFAANLSASQCSEVCILFMNVTRGQSFTANAFVQAQSFYGLVFVATRYTEVTVGAPFAAILTGVTVASLNNQTFIGSINASIRMGTWTDSTTNIWAGLRYGGYFHFEYAPTGTGAWQTQSFIADINAALQAAARYGDMTFTLQNLTMGAVYDVRMYVSNIYSRGPASNVVSVGLVELPKTISELTIGDTFNTTDGFTEKAVFLPVRFRKDRPAGGSVLEYAVDVEYYFYQGSTEYTFRLGTFSVATSNTSDYVDTTLPFAIPYTTRLSIRARNIAGWAPVYRGSHSPGVKPVILNFKTPVVDPKIAQPYQPYGTAAVVYFEFDIISPNYMPIDITLFVREFGFQYLRVFRFNSDSWEYPIPNCAEVRPGLFHCVARRFMFIGDYFRNSDVRLSWSAGSTTVTLVFHTKVSAIAPPPGLFGAACQPVPGYIKPQPDGSSLVLFKIGFWGRSQDPVPGAIKFIEFRPSRVNDNYPVYPIFVYQDVDGVFDMTLTRNGTVGRYPSGPDYTSYLWAVGGQFLFTAIVHTESCAGGRCSPFLNAPVFSGCSARTPPPPVINASLVSLASSPGGAALVTARASWIDYAPLAPVDTIVIIMKPLQPYSGLGYEYSETRGGYQVYRPRGFYSIYGRLTAGVDGSSGEKRFSFSVPGANYYQFSLETSSPGFLGSGSPFNLAGTYFSLAPPTIAQVFPVGPRMSAAFAFPLKFVFDPPLAGTAEVEWVRYRVDSTTIIPPAPDTLVLSGLSIGFHRLSFSYDGVNWDDSKTIDFEITALPLNAVATADKYMKILHLRNFTLFQDGLRGVNVVTAVLGNLNSSCVHNTNDSRYFTCPAVSYTPAVPTPILIKYHFDNHPTILSTTTTIIFWDPIRVSGVMVADPAPGRSCTTSGSSTLRVRLRRWPFLPSETPVLPLLVTPVSEVYSDPFAINATYDTASGDWIAPMPFVPQSDYLVALLSDSDITPFSFTFQECADTAMAACMRATTCEQCGSISTCSWAAPPGGYGICIPKNAPAAKIPLGYVTYSTNCPENYFGLLTPPTPMTVVRATAPRLRVRSTTSMQIVSRQNNWAGTGTWICESDRFEITGQVSGTFVFGPGNYNLAIACEALIDPRLDYFGGGITFRVESAVSLPRRRFIAAPFRPSAVLDDPEFLGTEPSVAPGIVYDHPARFIARVTLPDFVSSVRWYITSVDGLTKFYNLTADIDPGQFCPEVIRVSLGNTVDLPANTYVLRFVVNEGQNAEFVVIKRFDVVALPSFFSQFFTITRGLIKKNSICIGADLVSFLDQIAKICVLAEPIVQDSNLFPGLVVGTGIRMGMGLSISNCASNPQLNAGPSSGSPTKNRECVRVRVDVQFRFDYNGNVGGAMTIAVTFYVGDVAVISQGTVSVTLRVVPRTPTTARSVDFVEAYYLGETGLRLTPPDGLTGYRCGPFFASLNFEVIVGPIIRICNPTWSDRCGGPIPSLPLKWNAGFRTRITLTVKLGLGVEGLAEVSVWTEGGVELYGEVPNPLGGARIYARFCWKVTVAWLISYGSCPGSWDRSWGSPIPQNAQIKRSIWETEEGIRPQLVQPGQWQQNFRGFGPSQSAASFKKRLVPVLDSGVFVADVPPSARPVSASHASSKLAMLVWVGYDNAQPVPKGAYIAYSLYNGTSELLSDVLPVRQTLDSDAAPFVTALPDGRFLLVFSSLPDLGDSANYNFANFSYAELFWAVYSPSSQIWTAPAQLTADSYFDSSPASVEFEDMNPTSPTFNKTLVMTVWTRSRDQFDIISQNKDIMSAVFNPATNAWSTPVVCVSGTGVRQSPSIAVVNDTILMTWINKFDENTTVAMMQYYSVVSGSWSASIPFGRDYDFAEYPGFPSQNITFNVSTALSPRQQSALVTSHDLKLFVVVWQEETTIMSRVYDVSRLKAVFAASAQHPKTQAVFFSQSDVPHGVLLVSAASGGRAGALLSWYYEDLQVGHMWAFSYILGDRQQWDPPVTAPHRPLSIPQTATVFSTQPDLAFVVFTTQEIGVYSNGTQYLTNLNMEYKRINLAPIVALEDVQLSLVSASFDNTRPFQLDLRVKNRGALPSEPGVLFVAQGSLDTYEEMTENSTFYAVPSVRPGLAAVVSISPLPLIPTPGSGYLWIKFLNSSSPPVRLALFNSVAVSVNVQRSSAQNQLIVSAAVRATSFSTAYRDVSTSIPVAFYTRSGEAQEWQPLATARVNCTLDGPNAQVSVVVPRSNVLQQIRAVAGPLDELVNLTTSTPSSSLSAIETSVVLMPNLRLRAANVELRDPFLGRASMSITLENSGLSDSRNVTIMVRNNVTGAFIASSFFPVVEGLTETTSVLPLSRAVVSADGLYTFEIDAQSSVSQAALNAYLGIANYTTTPTPPDMELDYGDNTVVLHDVHIYSPVSLAVVLDRVATFVRANVTVGVDVASVFVPIENSATDDAAANTPVYIYASGNGLTLTPLGNTTVTSIPAAQERIAQIRLDSAESAALLSQVLLLSNPTLTIVIPPYFSGTTSPIERSISLQETIGRPVPSASSSVATGPALDIPDVIFLKPGENSTIQLALRGISSGYAGLFSVRVLSTALPNGVSYNQASGALTYLVPQNAASGPVQVQVGIFMSSGAQYDRSAVVWQVYTENVVAPAPPPAMTAPTANTQPAATAPFDIITPTLDVAPSSPVAQVTAPVESGSAGSNGGAAAGGIIGALLAIILIVLVILAVLFVRRRRRGEVEKGQEVKAFFMPWKKSTSQSAAASVQMTPQQAAPTAPKPSKKPKAPVAAAPAATSSESTSSEAEASSSSESSAESSQSRSASPVSRSLSRSGSASSPETLESASHSGAQSVERSTSVSQSAESEDEEETASRSASPERSESRSRQSNARSRSQSASANSEEESETDPSGSERSELDSS